MKPKILIVDDDELVGKALAMICTRLGYDIEVAASANEALQAFQRGPWAGYLLDYKLPDGNGIDLARALRERGLHEPVIFITGYATPDLALEIQDLGVRDMLSKPFKTEDLKNLLDRHIPLSPPAPAPAGQTSRANTPHTVRRVTALAFLIGVGLILTALLLSL